MNRTKLQENLYNWVYHRRFSVREKKILDRIRLKGKVNYDGWPVGYLGILCEGWFYTFSFFCRVDVDFRRYDIFTAQYPFLSTLGNTHRLVSCKANTRLTTLHWCGGNVMYRLSSSSFPWTCWTVPSFFFTVQPCFLSHSMICLKGSAGSSIQLSPKRNWTFWFSYTWSPTLMEGRRKSFSDLNLRSSASFASLSRACCIPQLFLSCVNV